MQKNTQTARKNFTPGITADAKTLGVSRQHLFYVLSGRRTSKVLKQRYDELQAEKRKAAAK
jgi:hypothetical protein